MARRFHPVLSVLSLALAALPLCAAGAVEAEPARQAALFRDARSHLADRAFDFGLDRQP